MSIIRKEKGLQILNMAGFLLFLTFIFVIISLLVMELGEFYMMNFSPLELKEVAGQWKLGLYKILSGFGLLLFCGLLLMAAGLFSVLVYGLYEIMIGRITKSNETVDQQTEQTR